MYVPLFPCDLHHDPVLARYNRFDKPNKTLSDVQQSSSPGSQTSLNQQLAMRDASGYQAMGITRRVKVGAGLNEVS
nr:synaptotagmin-7-like isoform X3 [Biomphalaria glabrata]